MIVITLLMLMECKATYELTVRTRNGPVEGHLSYAGEHALYAFKNIPFAKQPVGNLRFQHPEEPENWFSESDLPTDEIHCPQPLFYNGQKLSNIFRGQEDCLYLDVYVRQVSDWDNSSLSVLIYFHGGLFTHGSKEEYGPDFLLRFNEIILVIPNYRLGILGYLSNRDSILTGNFGLWDQHAALKWVNENIQYFGGNPQKVTIAGHEAGGASVGFHILAPVSHNYFQGAISISGTSLSSLFFDKDPSSAMVYKVANALHCSTGSRSEMLACLKTADLQDILKIQAHANNNPLQSAFLPVTDSAAENPLLPSFPKYLYHEGYQKNVNYLFGFTGQETSFAVSREFPKVLKYQHLDKMIRHFLQPHLQNVSNFEMIAKAAKYHYLRGIVIPSFESIEPHIANMMTDFLYTNPLEQVVRLHSRKTENVFLYKLKSRKENFCGGNRGECYGDEFYLFNSSIGEETFDESNSYSERTTEVLSKLWGNFVKYGYPDVDGIWKPHRDNELNYAEISDSVQPKVNYDRHDSEFWSSLVSDLKKAQNTSVEGLYNEQLSEYPTVGTWGATGLAILSGVLCIALVGLVVITKRRTLYMSIVPISSKKDINFSNV